MVRVIVTFLATSYLINKNTIKAVVSSVTEMEAFNEIGRVEAWDLVEELLINGCNKEALELVKIQQHMALTDLKRHVRSDQGLIRMIEDKNPGVAKRIANVKKINSYAIPTCK